MSGRVFQVKRKLILLVGGLLLFALILVMPRPSGVTTEGQHMAAVAFLMAIWWIGEVVPLAVTGLLPLVLYPLLGIMPSKDVAPQYGNHLVFLFLGGFMIALAMERWNFHKRVALAIIRAIGNTPTRVVFGFMVATAFLSMWISNTATTMMMFPVAMAVVRQIAEHASYDGQSADTAQVESHFGLVMMLGLAYSASIGGVGTLIGTPPNIVFAGFYKNMFPDRPEVTFLEWMLMALPVVMAFLPLVWWYLCRFAGDVPLTRLKVNDGVHAVVDREIAALGAMTRAEKWVALVFGATAFLWIFRSPVDLGGVTIPGWSQLFPWPKYLHDSTVAMFMGLFLMIAPLGLPGGMMREGRREYFLLDWKSVQEGVPWGILLLFGGGFALAAGFQSTGLDQWIGGRLSGVGSIPLWAVVGMLCLGITFLTEVTSNTATATMIFPIIAGVAVAAGFEPLSVMVPAAMSASFAFMMPVATAPNAIVFGSGWVTIPKMARTGFFLNLIGATLMTVMSLLVIQHLI